MSIYDSFKARLAAEPISKGRTDTRKAELTLADNGDGGSILGIVYSCDFRSEEETGAGEMAKIFTRTADADSFLAKEYLLQDGNSGPIQGLTQAELVSVDEELIVFQAKPRIYDIEREHQSALSYLRQAAQWERDRSSSKYWRSTATELKALAKSRGIKGYSKLKLAELERLHLDYDYNELHKDDAFAEITSQPGWFHNGSILAFERKDTLFTEVLLKLVEAAKAGYLVVGGGGVNPFGSGFSLFDSRDFTPALEAQISASNLWYREQMALLKPVAEIVKEGPMKNRWGSSYYFLGRPTAMDGVVRYWLNGNSVELPNGRSSQPFGYYSLDELLAEKYMDDLRVKSDDDFKRFDSKGNYRPTALTDAEAEAELKARGLSWASK